MGNVKRLTKDSTSAEISRVMKRWDAEVDVRGGLFHVALWSGPAMDYYHGQRVSLHAAINAALDAMEASR